MEQFKFNLQLWWFRTVAKYFMYVLNNYQIKFGIVSTVNNQRILNNEQPEYIIYDNTIRIVNELNNKTSDFKENFDRNTYNLKILKLSEKIKKRFKDETQNGKATGKSNDMCEIKSDIKKVKENRNKLYKGTVPLKDKEESVIFKSDKMFSEERYDKN